MTTPPLNTHYAIHVQSDWAINGKQWTRMIVLLYAGEDSAQLSIFPSYLFVLPSCIYCRPLFIQYHEYSTGYYVHAMHSEMSECCRVYSVQCTVYTIHCTLANPVKESMNPWYVCFDRGDGVLYSHVLKRQAINISRVRIECINRITGYLILDNVDPGTSTMYSRVVCLTGAHVLWYGSC